MPKFTTLRDVQGSVDVLKGNERIQVTTRSAVSIWFQVKVGAELSEKCAKKIIETYCIIMSRSDFTHWAY